MKEIKTFEDALKFLGIEEYYEKIFHSNSRGELYFLDDYVLFAQIIQENYGPEAPALAKEAFEEIVKNAYETWNRPQSVFQHVIRDIAEMLREVEKVEG